MALEDYVFTSESVSEGHPDKLCDRISDTVVDAFLAEAPEARVACETLATTNKVVIAGETRGPESVTKEKIIQLARDSIRDIGYEQDGFHWKDTEISCLLHEQAFDIAMGVDRDGAGDQGLMFGYACEDTPELMPAPIHYSHKLLKSILEARKSNELEGFGPDAKTQLTVRYKGGKPVGLASIVLSIQHNDENLSPKDIFERVYAIINNALPAGWFDKENLILNSTELNSEITGLDEQKTLCHINPTGKFVIGGPVGDCGLTGRKIIVDTYGGAAPHGGGAFSGKDPTKVDRSAAYAARYLAKNVVAAKLAERCTIQLSYAIGVSDPQSLYVDLHGSGSVDETKLAKTLREVMDLTPRGIRTQLDLNKPIYARTSAYGHFGRKPEGDGGFSWENIDLVDSLKGAFY